jgi:hypothetical protein
MNTPPIYIPCPHRTAPNHFPKDNKTPPPSSPEPKNSSSAERKQLFLSRDDEINLWIIGLRQKAQHVLEEFFKISYKNDSPKTAVLEKVETIQYQSTYNPYLGNEIGTNYLPEAEEIRLILFTLFVRIVHERPTYLPKEWRHLK